MGQQAEKRPGVIPPAGCWAGWRDRTGLSRAFGHLLGVSLEGRDGASKERLLHQNSGVACY